MPYDGDLLSIRALLEPGQRARLDALRAFLDAEIRPEIDAWWDRGEFAAPLADRMTRVAELILEGSGGRYAFPHPEPLFLGLLKLELGRCDPSLTSFFSVHWGLAMGSIAMFGGLDQQARWLPGMSRLALRGSFALTEPEHGSDVAGGTSTVARWDGAGWVLHGDKKWAGSGNRADVIVTFAQEAPDAPGPGGTPGRSRFLGFLVPGDAPGLVAERIPGKIAKRALDNALITLRGVRLAEDARLPGVARFADVARLLNHGRALVAWEACGIAQGATEAALAYCLRRQQFGRPIAGFQLVQGKLAQMVANVTTMQALLLRLAQREADTGTVDPAEGALAKLVCGQRMRETVALAREVLGGNGILLEHGVARLFADAEAVYSYEGTHEMLSLILGRHVTGLAAFT